MSNISLQRSLILSFASVVTFILPQIAKACTLVGDFEIPENMGIYPDCTLYPLTVAGFIPYPIFNILLGTVVSIAIEVLVFWLINKSRKVVLHFSGASLISGLILFAILSWYTRYSGESALIIFLLLMVRYLSLAIYTQKKITKQNLRAYTSVFIACTIGNTLGIILILFYPFSKIREIFIN